MSLLVKLFHTSYFKKSEFIYFKLYKHLLTCTKDEMLPRKEPQVIFGCISRSVFMRLAKYIVDYDC
jgi:hypothetical protein